MKGSYRLFGFALLACMAPMASASLVLVSPIEQSGTGLGAVNTVLTIQSPGSSTVETGCVAPSGAGTTTAGCGFADSNVQSITGTPTLAALGITSASEIRIVFNAAEPGNADNSIQLDQLVLKLYTLAGLNIDTHSLPAAILFPTIQNGTGNSGFVFGLNANETNSAQTIINANGGVSNIRVGLGAQVSLATGGKETFFVEDANLGRSGDGGGGSGGGAVPEPASMILIGAGLLSLGTLQRKFRSAA